MKETEESIKPVNFPDSPPCRLLSPAQAAHYLGIALPTLYTMCSQRRIPYVKIGRLNKFDTKQLESWISTHTVLPLKAP
jgi:excisionase family DNA binding protein